jgi:hypothetical protein
MDLTTSIASVPNGSAISVAATGAGAAIGISIQYRCIYPVPFKGFSFGVFVWGFSRAYRRALIPSRVAA